LMEIAASEFVKAFELPDSVFAAISARLSHYNDRVYQAHAVPARRPNHNCLGQSSS